MPKKVLKLIGFKEYKPQITFTSNCRRWSMKDCKRPGSDVEFLKVLFDFAGLEYELIQHDADSSNEIIESVANGTADMSLIALIASPARLKRVAFTIPVSYLQFGYIAQELNILESDKFLIKTFQAEIYWVLTLVIALVAGFTFIAYGRYTYKQWLWFTFSSFFNQNEHPKSRKTSFLFLTGSFWYTAFLTTCFYQARMKYFLTVPLQKGVDFYNMEQLLDQVQNGKWTVYEADDGYTLGKYCRLEQCARVEDLIKKGKIIHHKNLSSFDDATINQQYAVTLAAWNVETVPNPVSIFDRKQQLLFIHDSSISVDMVAFVINKNHTEALEKINRAISRFSSSYANILNRYQSPHQRYELETPQNGAVVLTLLHYDILFYCYIALVSTSLLIFGIEFLHFRYNWKNNSGKWMPKEIKYDMNGSSLSTDSTLRSVNFKRKTIKFFIEEKIAELQKVNGLEN